MAPADPRNPNFPKTAHEFNNLPTDPLPISSYLVVSNDDPYIAEDRAEFLATCWGSTLIMLEGSGHLNSNSDLYIWPAGKKLLDELIHSITDRLF